MKSCSCGSSCVNRVASFSSSSLISTTALRLVSMKTILPWQLYAVIVSMETIICGDVMRAAVVEEFGQTPHLVEVDKPAPETGKQVARVRAAALKNIERMLASGEHYGAAHMKMPMTVGLDAVVELDGDLVYTGATPPEGAMAEFMSIDPDQVVRLPVGVDPATA